MYDATVTMIKWRLWPFEFQVDGVAPSASWSAGFRVDEPWSQLFVSNIRSVQPRVFRESIYSERDDTSWYSGWSVFPVRMASRSHALDMLLMRRTLVRNLSPWTICRQAKQSYGYVLSLYRSRIRSPQSETPQRYVDDNLWRWKTLTLMTFVRKECRCQWTTCDVDLVAYTAIQLPRIIPSS